jgi:pilus assembly protein CpaC
MASDVEEIVGRFIDRAKIINKLSIETATQVLLKVKIAEVSRTLTKSLGINWKALSGSAGSGTNYGFVAGETSALPVFTSDGNTDTAELSKTSGVLGGSAKGGRWLIHNNGVSGLTALIEALASESFASVLAEPTLIALSGKTAIFKSGGEHGYKVKQSGSFDTSTTEFKEWGTSIEFTPIVMSEDRINIKVKPTVSTLDAVNGQDSAPSLTTKQAETTVELGSGQSLAIAGLLQTTKSTSAVETPFLAEIPLIKYLFRSSSEQTIEKELIIIITPYIVKPSSKQLKAPTDMVPKMYSPLDSILKRKFHKNIKKVPGAGFSIM